MRQYNLSEEEDIRLRASIILPFRKHSLYEYFCDLPLEQLKVYPKRGYHWWLGRASRTTQALALRDYILHWRLNALAFRQQYSRDYLETLSSDNLRLFLRTYIEKVPLWAYEEPVKDAIQLLSLRS